MIVKRLVSVFRDGGAGAVVDAIVRRLRMPHARSFNRARDAVQAKHGLEIGGPSPIFARGGLLPLYPHAERIDNCNFAARTIWEGDIVASEALSFRVARTPGRQYIAEGGHLPLVADGMYDFVLSSHMLEHTADPLRTLAEWRRVLRPGGTLVMILPHRDGTFDHRRALTTIEHLRADFIEGTGEDDQTHAEEALAMHDMSRDPGVENAEAFRARILRNVEVRSLHHHVFNVPLAVAAVREAGFTVVLAEALLPYHIIVLATREPDANQGVLSDTALEDVLRQSPFASDRA